MRSTILVLFALCLNIFDILGQNQITFKNPIEIVLSKNYSNELKEGSKIVISRIVRLKDINGFISFSYIGVDSLGAEYYLKESLVKNAIYPLNPSVDQVWEIDLIKNKVYEELLLNGYRFDIRKELNQEATSFIKLLSERDQFFNDAYLEDYLYRILNKIHKGYLTDGRPGNISIRVIKDATPNAMALPNGCIILTTGLISCMNSESQLIGVIAHEVAHFIYDHHILSYLKEQARQKRAEFWTGVVAGLAVATDAYLASNNRNYSFGVLSNTAIVAATLISEAVVKRMGINYNHDQEFSADILGKNVLKSLSIEDYAMAGALKLLKKHNYLSGDYSAIVGGESHPSIENRIYALGGYYSDTVSSIKYDADISFVNTYNAANLFYIKSDFMAALNLINRNITAKTGSAEDFLIKSRLIRRLGDTRESNVEALDLLNTSRQLMTEPSFWLEKDEALIQLRLNEKVKSVSCLNRYHESLKGELPNSKQSINFDYLDFLRKEISWAVDMINKIESL